MGAVLRNSASLTKEGRSSGAEGVRVWCEGQGRAWCPPSPEAAFGACRGCGQVWAAQVPLAVVLGHGDVAQLPSAFPPQTCPLALPPTPAPVSGSGGRWLCKGQGPGLPLLVLPSRLLLVGSPGLLAAHRCGLPRPACLPAIPCGAAVAGRVLLGPDPAPFVPILCPPLRRHPRGASQQGCSSPVSHRCCSSLAPVARLFS